MGEMGGVLVLSSWQEGVLDVISEAKPSVEFYADQRVAWIGEVEGAIQQNKTD